MTGDAPLAATPGPLLQTKLFAPRVTARARPRPRLAASLGGGDQAAVVLVSAPAGFGKSTLLAQALLGGRPGPAR